MASRVWLMVVATALMFGALPALAHVVVQAYDGPPLAPTEISRIYLGGGIFVVAINGRAVADQNADSYELLPGPHMIQVLYRPGPVVFGYLGAGDQRFARGSVPVRVDAEAGSQHEIRTVGRGDDAAPEVVPYRLRLKSSRDRREVVCWLDEVAGSIEAWDRKHRLLVLRTDDDTVPQEWRVADWSSESGQARVYARPRSRLQELAADEKGFMIGWSELTRGKRVRATWSSCEPGVIREIRIED